MTDEQGRSGDPPEPPRSEPSRTPRPTKTIRRRVIERAADRIRGGGRGRPADPDRQDDRRLARLHLRTGSLALAAAELDELAVRGVLDTSELADLAEARWRTGDLERAAAAARAHLAAGGRRTIAHVIVAESAVAVGRPEEANEHVGAAGPLEPVALDTLFAGIGRRAYWPSSEAVAASPAAAPAAPGADGPVMPPPDGREPGQLGVPVTDPTSAALPVPRGRRVGRRGRGGDAPAGELARAREELRSGDPGDTGRGLTRLALVLRAEPSLATAVLEALGGRRDPAALLVRGDACRLLGRDIESEAAFVEAAAGLDGSSRRRDG